MKRNLFFGLFLLIVFSFATLGIIKGNFLQGYLISPSSVILDKQVLNNSSKLDLSPSSQAFLALSNNHYLDQTGLSLKNLNDPISREQSVYMAFQVLNPMVGKSAPFYGVDGINKNYLTCFNDIGNSYAKIFICWTRNFNFLTLQGNNFLPNTKLKRYEAITLIGNILKEKFYADFNQSNNLFLKYPDKNLFPNYPDLEKNLKLLTYKNIIPFEQSKNFSPDSPILVGEFSEMLFRAKLVNIYESTAYSPTLSSNFAKDNKLCKTPNLVNNNESLKEEQINFIALESNTKANPNWKTDANNLIEEVNQIYNPAGMKFVIANFITMPAGVANDITQYFQAHPEYFNKSIKDPTSKVKGLSIFTCFGSLDEYNKTCPFAKGGGPGNKARQGNVIIQGEQYGYIVFYGTDIKNQDGVFAHEIGHYFETSNSPVEWYALHGIDGIYPLDLDKFLVDYYFCKDNAEYWQDPMCISYKTFTAQSIKTIKVNGMHKYNEYAVVAAPKVTNDYYQPMREFRSEKIRLKVTLNNKALPNAEVKVFFPNQSASKLISTNEYINPYFQGKTDANGEIYLDAPYSSQNFHSFLIKVKNGNETKKKFITYVEMEASSLINNACTSDLTISF